MAPFFEAARRHTLVVQRCDGCGALRFPARAICSACLSRAASWVPVSGRGKVFSFAVMHHANHPGFAAEVPYAVVVIELAEGVRMLSNLIDCPADRVRIDLPVTVVFDDVTPEVTLPKFRPEPSHA
jgi:hypothetical protein